MSYLYKRDYSNIERDLQIIHPNDPELNERIIEYLKILFNKHKSIPNENIVGKKRKAINFLLEHDIIVKEKSGLPSHSYYTNKVNSIGAKRIIKKVSNKKIKYQADKNDKRYVCSECEYKWETKKKFGEPFKCPKCGSRHIINFKELKRLLSKE